MLCTVSAWLSITWLCCLLVREADLHLLVTIQVVFSLGLVSLSVSSRVSPVKRMNFEGQVYRWVRAAAQDAFDGLAATLQMLRGSPLLSPLPCSGYP